MPITSPRAVCVTEATAQNRNAAGRMYMYIHFIIRVLLKYLAIKLKPEAFGVE